MQDAGAAGPAENPDAKTEAGEEKVLFAPERAPKMHTLHASHFLINCLPCSMGFFGFVKGTALRNHR